MELEAGPHEREGAVGSFEKECDNMLFMHEII